MTEYNPARASRLTRRPLTILFDILAMLFCPRFPSPVFFQVKAACLTACLLGTSLTALQAEPAAPAASPPHSALALPEDRVGGGVVWAVKSPTATIYLAGSIHMLREKDLPMPDIYDEVYDAVEELVFEVNMADMFNPQTVMEMRKMGRLPEGETLADHITEPTMAAIRQYLQERQLSENLISGFTPGMAYLTLSSLEASRHGARPDLGLEAHFYLRTLNDNTPSRGLETPAFQMSIFERISPKTLEEMLLKGIQEQEKFEEQLDTLISTWREGNEEGLVEEITSQMNLHTDAIDIMLYERNAQWVPEVEAALQGTKDVMFLVGAAHLVGEKSVVDLLRQKGHTVERIHHLAPAAAESAD